MQKKVIYTGYFIIVTVFFLYYLFPADALTSYVNSKINSLTPDIGLQITAVKPSFPPGVKLAGLELIRRNQSLVRADFFKIKPAYLSLFGDNKTFNVNGKLYGGDIDSLIRLSHLSSNPDYELDTTFSGIQIADIPALKQLESYQFSGTANGEIFYSNREVKAGKGNAAITLTDSSLGFTPALFGIEEVTFSSVNAEFDITGPQVNLKKLEVDSRDVSGSASGKIILRAPINRSTINIRGEIKPHPSFIKQLGNLVPVDMLTQQQSKTGGIPFRISGSIERPNFAFR